MALPQEPSDDPSQDREKRFSVWVIEVEGTSVVAPRHHVIDACGHQSVLATHRSTVDRRRTTKGKHAEGGPLLVAFC
jgi:hypothetical protein